MSSFDFATNDKIPTVPQMSSFDFAINDKMFFHS